MKKKNGILEDKFDTYYKDINLFNYRPILSEAINSYQGNYFHKVLDIGSGIELFLESIKPFGFELYALEASRTGISALKEKNINTYDFLLEKEKALPFDDNSFSLVLFNQVIEHIDKETGEYYIKEIIRILEPGGVAIVKSPSYYSKIWRTDPHHIYCWKPNELLYEVQKYYPEITSIQLQRVALEPWMLFKYNEDIIDTWHKYNKYPKLKRLFGLVGKMLDKIIYNISGSDVMLAVSNVTFVKNTQK